MEIIRCKCGHPIPFDNPNFCSHCGNKLKDYEQMISNFINCPYCLHVIPRSQAYCENCGNENLYIKEIMNKNEKRDWKRTFESKYHNEGWQAGRITGEQSTRLEIFTMLAHDWNKERIMKWIQEKQETMKDDEIKSINAWRELTMKNGNKNSIER